MSITSSSRTRAEYEAAEEAEAGPSKTQVKQAMLDLQDVGVELLKLSGAQLDKIPMDERLREALREHGRMPTREAKRRHMAFIGKMLRNTDSEPVTRALVAIRAGESRLLAEAEVWRERLLSDDAAMTEWIKAHPRAEVQPLRALVRNTRRELEAALAADPENNTARSKSRAFRELFQKIRVELQVAAKAQ